MLLYLVTASGFALNLHYCGTFITSVKIDEPAKKCSAEAMRCCHDQHIEVKVKDAHQGQSVSYSAKLFAVNLPRVQFGYQSLPAQQTLLVVCVQRGPPDTPGGTAVYIRNRVFRI